MSERTVFSDRRHGCFASLGAGEDLRSLLPSTSVADAIAQASRAAWR